MGEGFFCTNILKKRSYFDIKWKKNVWNLKKHPLEAAILSGPEASIPILIYGGKKEWEFPDWGQMKPKSPGHHVCCNQCSRLDMMSTSDRKLLVGLQIFPAIIPVSTSPNPHPQLWTQGSWQDATLTSGFALWSCKYIFLTGWWQGRHAFRLYSIQN